MIEIMPVLPEKLDELSPKAIYYLQQASEAMAGYFPVELAMEQTKVNVGAMYVVYDADATIGCFFLNYKFTHVGKVMNLILLGGENFKQWESQFSSFLHALAYEKGCSEFTVMGRKGWGRFSNLEHVACVFRKKL